MAFTSARHGFLQRLPLLSLGIGLSVAVVCSAISLWIFHEKVTVQSQSQVLAQTEATAQRRALTIARFIATTQQKLAVLAGREDLISLLTAPAADDPQQLEKDSLTSAVNSALREVFPELLSAHLIDSERNLHLGETPYTLSFIELDMINKSSRNKLAKPEAMLHDSNKNLLFITAVHAQPDAAGPAQGDNPVIGNLLIRLPIKYLQQALNHADSFLGRTRIYQDIPRGKPILITTLGEGIDTPLIKQYVDKSNWHITFSPSRDLLNNASVDPVPVTLICAIVSVCLSLLSYFLSRRFVDMPAPAPAPKQARNAPRTADADTDPTAPAELHSDDIFDIDLSSEDEDLLGLAAAPVRQPSAPTEATMEVQEEVIDCPAQIFRAYDIRGIVDTEITADLAFQIGQAIGSEILYQGQDSTFVACDGRVHSPALMQQLIDGITYTGCHVISLGAVPTPLLYFATSTDTTTNSGVMVTASHNPAEYNGFKVVINGTTLAGEAIQTLRRRIVNREIHSGNGRFSSMDISARYIERVFSDVALAGPIKVVLDAGNGITGEIAPRLFEELGCEVIPLYCDVDGTFPNHEADPSRAENLADLAAKVQETDADLGLAFDGDGDRLGVVTQSGNIIWPDRLLMLFAKDIVTGHPGCDVLFDVKCSRELNNLVASYGGRPIMWKTGHSNMKAKMVETGALIGGELSGHIFIKDRWYGFDDGMYAGARLLEIMTLRDQSLDDIFTSFPALPSTPEIKVPVDESIKFSLIESLISTGQFENGNFTTLDGLRVDFAKGWGLVRASNTSPALTLRFEGESESVIHELQQLFKRELLKINPDLMIPF